MNLPLFFKSPLFSPDGEGSGGAAPGAAAPEGAPAQATPADAPAAPDYSWVPEDFRTDTGVDTEKFTARWKELTDPAPDAYEWKMPADLDLGVKLPDGVEIAPQMEQYQPLYEELGGVLKEHNLPQSAASQVMGVLGKYEAQRFAKLHEGAQTEFDTLGSTADQRQQRIGTLKRAIESKLPATDAAALMSMAVSAAGVKALEKLLQPTGPGTSTPTPTPPDDDPYGFSSRYKS